MTTDRADTRSRPTWRTVDCLLVTADVASVQQVARSTNQPTHASTWFAEARP